MLLWWYYTNKVVIVNNKVEDDKVDVDDAEATNTTTTSTDWNIVVHSAVATITIDDIFHEGTYDTEDDGTDDDSTMQYA